MAGAPRADRPSCQPSATGRGPHSSGSTSILVPRPRAVGTGAPGRVEGETTAAPAPRRTGRRRGTPGARNTSLPGAGRCRARSMKSRHDPRRRTGQGGGFHRVGQPPPAADSLTASRSTTTSMVCASRTSSARASGWSLPRPRRTPPRHPPGARENPLTWKFGGAVSVVTRPLRPADHRGEHLETLVALVEFEQTRSTILLRPSCLAIGTAADRAVRACPTRGVQQVAG